MCTETEFLTGSEKNYNFAENSFSFQIIVVGYAIMETRSIDMNWKMVAIWALPLFLLLAL